ncbi:MAG: hypothetical protein ACQGTM_03535 [bacterium]
MKKNKLLSFVLCIIFFFSIALNLYFLIPKKHSESISMGYYLSRNTNGISYKLSVMENNEVLLYGDEDNLLYKGKLEYNEKENYYLIKTDSSTYQVVVRDDVIFLPITENGRIVSKLFTKIGSVPVSYVKACRPLYTGDKPFRLLNQNICLTF